MTEKTIAHYIITERRTGRRLARGSATDCARRLGLTYGSFLTMVSRARRGQTPYQVEQECLGWRQELVRRWDDSFGWYRAQCIPYPCGRCMKRTYCDHTGEYCDAFARWFTATYNEAARRLRNAAK